MSSALRDQPILVSHGDVHEHDQEDALANFRDALDTTDRTILDPVVKLTHHPDPARERPNHVEMSLLLDGRPVRAHASATTMREAIDAAIPRLRRRIERADERPRALALRHRDEAWHHGDPPAGRTRAFPRPEEERTIVRRKTFAMGPESIEDAICDLEALDHDFFLFVNETTGEENVVAREDGGYRVHQATPTPDELDRIGIPIGVGPPPAHMDTRTATQVLDASDAPFVFFIDVQSGRGNIVYRRYDGHYGLITPS